MAAGCCPFPGWTLISAKGRDVARFLQSQLTADVAALKAGQSCLSALLDRSARVGAFLFVLREVGSFRLLVPDELAAPTLDRLQNHVVADDAEFRQERTGSMALALGTGTAELAASRHRDTLFPLNIFGQRGFVTWSSEPIDLPPLSPEEMAWRRIISGFPRWGIDVKAGQLVTETTLVDIAVAHRKGCYLGQETVHKIQTRRGAAFSPMALEAVTEISDPESFPGRPFTIGEDKGGKVLDWAIWDDHLVFEVSLHRTHRVDGLETSCLFDDGQSIDGRVRRLPVLESRALKPPQSS